MKILRTIYVSLALAVPALSLAANGAGKKIVIIDTGIYSGSFGASRIIDQFCWSRPDVITPDSTNATEKWVHYDIASLCPNGAPSDFNSNNAATVPRITEHNFREIYPFHNFGSRHGSTVFEEAAVTAGGAQFIIVSNAFYKAAQAAAPGVACGYHGPDASLPDNRRPTDFVKCYVPADAEQQANLMTQFSSRSDVAAINFSATTSFNCNANNPIFRLLKEKNIAFIASAGNGGASAPIGYPACNPNVISVGALNRDLSLSSTTSLNGRIDFFAEGRAPGFLNAATSWAAPVVSGAFAIMQSAEPQQRTLSEMKAALAFTAPGCINHRGKCVPIVTKESAEAAGECLRTDTCRTETPPGDGGIGYEDSGQYGPIHGDDISSYEIDIDFKDLLGGSIDEKHSDESSHRSQPQAKFFSVPNERDVVLTFKAQMSDTFSTRNGMRVLINNTVRESTGYFEGEQEFRYVLSRNWFSTGNNTVKLSPLSTSSSRPWGVSNITAELNPIVRLTVGTLDTTEYGYEHTPERLTGLRTAFNLDDVINDVSLSVTGWDIDEDDETQVFVNGRDYGFLTQGTVNNSYSVPDTFILRKADLIQGDNIVEFVQQKPGGTWLGIEDEKWAVRDLLLTLALPDLTPQIFQILDRTIESEVPFSIETTVRNNGVGASDPSVLRFYISPDSIISTSDSFVGSAALLSLQEQRTRTVITSVQSSQVNSGMFIGVCINAVAGESNTQNNCSEGVLLRNNIVIMPTLMLLLE